MCVDAAVDAFGYEFGDGIKMVCGGGGTGVGGFDDRIAFIGGCAREYIFIL